MNLSIVITLSPIKERYCDERVCLSVCEWIIMFVVRSKSWHKSQLNFKQKLKAKKPIYLFRSFAKFSVHLNCPYSRGSVPLWRRRNAFCASVVGLFVNSI